MATARDLVWRAGRSRLRQSQGAIETVYTSPPPRSLAVCLDQMGPVAVKSYPGKQLVSAHPTASTPAERARQEIDYGRREKAGYVFGALQPSTGETFTASYTRRTLLNWIDFLQQVEEWIPQDVERVYAVLDNLTMHRAVDVLLFNLAYPRWEARVSAHLRGVLELDRALVEDLALSGAQRAALRNVARGGGSGAKSDGLLEYPQASLRVGQTPSPSATQEAWDCTVATSGLNLSDAPLSGAFAKSREHPIASSGSAGGRDAPCGPRLA
jgi:hypothetical protein